MNKYRIASAVIISVIVVAIGAGITQTMTYSKNDRERAISQEFLTCLSAICVDKSPGHQCLEQRATVSRVILSEDTVVKGARRLIIETSDKECGTSIYK